MLMAFSTPSFAHESPVNEQGCHGILIDTVYLHHEKTHLNIYDTHCHNEGEEQEELFQEIDIEEPDEVDTPETPPAPPVILNTGFYFGTMTALAPNHDTTEEGVEFDNANLIGVFLGTKINQNFGYEFIIKKTITQTKISTTVTTGDNETLPVEADGTTNLDSTIFNVVVYANPRPTGEQFFASYGIGSSKASYDGVVNNNDIAVDLGDDFTVTRTLVGMQFKIKDVTFASGQSQSWYMRVGLFNEKHGATNTVSGIEVGLIVF